MTFLGGPQAILPITKDMSAAVYAYMDDEYASLNNDILGLILRSSKTAQPSIVQTILLLEPEPKPEGKCYQRIGILRVDHRGRTRPQGRVDPQIVYLDKDKYILDQIDMTKECPLWLEEGTEQEVDII